MPAPLRRKRLPKSLPRRTSYAVRDGLRQLTHGARCLPHFLIVGAQKGGTTSLFKALEEHPRVVAPVTKELHFFDRTWRRGLGWYRAHFPLRAGLGGRLTGEASPSYLFAPAAAERIARVLPEVRLVLLLREPVARAWSHYRMMSRLGYEQRPFEQALAEEPEQQARALELLEADPDRDLPGFWRHSYMARGDYLTQLRRLEQHHARERLLVLRSEDLFAGKREPLDALGSFLGLEGLGDRPLPGANAAPGPPPPIPPAALDRLERYFAPRHAALAEHLGRPLWPESAR